MEAISAKPIKPTDITTYPTIPPIVIEVVNQLIIENGHDYSIRVLQTDIVNRLMFYYISKEEIYGKRMLDFENIYRKAGWDVEYTKRSTENSDQSYFTFIGHEFKPSVDKNHA
jgi:hypothetical protein